MHFIMKTLPIKMNGCYEQVVDISYIWCIEYNTFITFELVLKIIKFLFKHKQSNYVSSSWDYFRKSMGALRHYFGKSL